MAFNPIRRTVLRSLALAFGVALAASPTAAGAQDFPAQPIRIIVPISPGGATDVGTRGLTATAAEAISQPLIIDNVVGAAGVTGMVQVMNAKPDGHTLLSFDSSLITLPMFQPNVPVRLAQFRPVGIFQIRGAWLLTRPKSGWKTLDDFVQAARSRPGQLTVGVPSKGSPQELAVTALEDTYKIKVNIIPYQGGAPTMAALLGDQIDAAMTGSPAGLDSIKSGQAIFLIASTKIDIEGFPGKITSFADAGIPHDVSIWTAIWAPAKTPDPVVTELGNIFGRMAKHPKYTEFSKQYGTAPVWMGPEQSKNYIAASDQAHQKLFEILQKRGK